MYVIFQKTHAVVLTSYVHEYATDGRRDRGFGADTAREPNR